MTKRKKAVPLLTAMRFTQLYPQLVWPLENITGKYLKVLNQTEAARTLEDWIYFIYGASIQKGRQLEYDRAIDKLKSVLIGPRP